MNKYSGLILVFYTTLLSASQITIVGCGYVGLTLAALLADAGHAITCVDIDAHKIAALRQQQLPIYEPGLYELLFNRDKKRDIHFTTAFDTIDDSDMHYICVPTPINEYGGCDCSYVRTACAAIINTRRNVDTPLMLVIKSTVVPGTVRMLQDEFKASSRNVHFVYNPEFMREGSALHDMRLRNPIVLGAESEYALCQVEQVLTTCLSAPTAVIKTNFETAELIKYSWNTFSALRIAYVNELACVCRSLGADVMSVVHGLALSEELLPTKQLKPGPGYGGSCLPKDTTAFAHMLTNLGFNTTIAHRAIESNYYHKQRVVSDIISMLETKSQTKLASDSNTVTLLGLAFKANTNDIRYSIALDIIPRLLAQGIRVKAYDPQAMPVMQLLHQDVEYCTSAYDAIIDTDCIVILTEWQEFKDLDLEILASWCRKKNIIDTRNLFNTHDLTKHGFRYLTMGTV